MTSLRYFSVYPSPPFYRQHPIEFLIVFLLTVGVGFSISVAFGIILLFLPLYIMLCIGVVQHLLFREQVNKKFDYEWLVAANAIEKILTRKKIPFQRKYFDRKVLITLDEEVIEIVVTPCESYLHPRVRQIRWIVSSKGNVSDIAIQPLTEETYPLIDRLTLEIDAEIAKARQQTLVQEETT